MNKDLIKSERGFTIIEVLIGAFIFMLGFSILIFLLSRLMVNYSVDEISTANRIAQNAMERTIVLCDTASQTSEVICSNIKYSVVEKVTLFNGYAQVAVEVKRANKEKILCRLYYEYDIKKD